VGPSPQIVPKPRQGGVPLPSASLVDSILPRAAATQTGEEIDSRIRIRRQVGFLTEWEEHVHEAETAVEKDVLGEDPCVESLDDIGGGIPGDKKFKAVQTGGPSGGCIPESLIDLKIDIL